MLKKIGEVLLPVLIYQAITFAVSMFWTMGLIMLNINDIGSSQNTTEIMTRTLQVYMQSILLITFIGAVMTIPIVYYHYRKDRIIYEENMPEKWNINAYSFVVLIGIGACILGNNIFQLSGMIDLSASYQQVEKTLYYERSIWVQIMGTGITIPIAEELIFRGLIFKRIRRYSGFATAAFASTLFFSLFHGNMVQAVYAIMLGFLMAYVCEAYGNVAAPIVLHCTANLVSITITNVEVIRYFYERQAVILTMTAVAAVCLIAGVRLIKNEIFPLRAEEETS